MVHLRTSLILAWGDLSTHRRSVHEFRVPSRGMRFWVSLAMFSPCSRNFVVSRAILWQPVVVASLLLSITVSQSQAETVRVATFNLLHGGPWSGLIGNGADLNERLELVVQQLAALRPDVVALQEASVGGQRGNVAERLGRALGFEWIHAPTTSQVFGIGWLDRTITSAIRFNEGPAVLSRFPIKSSEIVELPRCANRLFPRVLLRVHVQTPRGPLDFYSTHT